MKQIERLTANNKTIKMEKSCLDTNNVENKTINITPEVKEGE